MAKDDPKLKDEELGPMDDQFDESQKPEGEDVELKPNEGVDPDDFNSARLTQDHDSDESLKSRDIEEAEHHSFHEHSLDDLAEEEEKSVPIGVNPSGSNPSLRKFTDDDSDLGPRKGSLRDDLDEEYSESIPPLNSSRSSIYNDGFSRRSTSASNRSRLLILGLVALLVIGGAIYLLKGRIQRGAAPEPSPSETPVASTTSTPSPSPSIDRSKYKIRVLNGTSTTGLAASVSGKLKNLGYQIDRTGNATNSAFTSTLVTTKSGISGLLDALVKDLSPDYSATSSGGNLKDSDTADAEVVIGTK